MPYLNFIAIIIFLLSSCQNIDNNKIELIGHIDKFKAKLSMNHDGDKFKGQIKYTDLNKPIIELSGTLMENELVLYEYDKNNNLSGIFEGQFDYTSYSGFWYPPSKNKKISFSFVGKISEKLNPPINTSSKKFVKLDSKELINAFFNVDKFTLNKTAHCIKNEERVEVEVSKIMYLYKKKQALVFFSNYPLESDGTKDDSHAASGFVSIAKLEKVDGNWIVINFCEDCGFGLAWGETNIPKLVKVEDTYFLIGESGYVNQGYSEGGSCYYETNTFKKVLCASDLSNSAASPNEDEIYSYSSKIRLEVSNGRIKAIIVYKGTDIDENKNKIIDISRTEIYYYDKLNSKFIKE